MGRRRKRRLTRPAPDFPIPQRAPPSLPQVSIAKQSPNTVLQGQGASGHARGLSGMKQHLPPCWRNDSARLPPHPADQWAAPTPGVTPGRANSPHSPGVTSSDAGASRVNSPHHTLHARISSQLCPEGVAAATSWSGLMALCRHPRSSHESAGPCMTGTWAGLVGLLLLRQDFSLVGNMVPSQASSGGHSSPPC